ncbi:hypothetical protein D1872_303710 [compost metagenome]
MCFVILFYQCYLLFGAACAAQISERLGIYREEANRSTILWSHVRYGCAVSKTDISETWSVIFNEFTYYTLLTKHLSNSQRKVCCCCTLGEATCKLEANNVRSYEI